MLQMDARRSNPHAGFSTIVRVEVCQARHAHTREEIPMSRNPMARKDFRLSHRANSRQETVRVSTTCNSVVAHFRRLGAMKGHTIVKLATRSVLFAVSAVLC